jgi:glycine cleavage system regulatory protein
MTTALAKYGLSIDKMETDQEIAPHGGSMLFRMHGVATAYEPLSSGFDISKIKRELQDLGDSLNCDVSLEGVVDDKFDASFYG